MIHFGRLSVRSGLLLAALLTLGFVIYTAVLESPIFSFGMFPFRHTSADRKRGSCTSWPRCRTDIFSFDADQVERDLMEHPWVSRAQVSKRLPDRVDVILSDVGQPGSSL